MTRDETAVVHPLSDAMGRPSGYAAVKRPLASRPEVSDAPENAHQLESVGRLAGGVAHNYNNLLMSIIGFGELLLLRMRPGDARRRHVEEILKASERAAAPTRMVLAFGRGQLLMPKEIDVNVLIGILCRRIGTVVGADIVLEKRLGASLGAAYADPAQVERVLVDLAANAREAMPEGGTLTIEAANVEFAQPCTRRNVRVRRGNYVMIAVSDTGIGMDEEMRSRIFEPFFSTKEGRTGLGLSAAYGIVKQSGGYIWVSSEPRRGTTVTIYLPRVEWTAEAIPQTAFDRRAADCRGMDEAGSGRDAAAGWSK